MAAVRRKKLKQSTSRALDLLWKKFGGPVAAAKLFSEHPSVIVNWTIRGKVPLLKTEGISKLINVPSELLNFKQVSQFYGLKRTWEEVVKKSKMFKGAELDYIFSGEMPK